MLISSLKNYVTGARFCLHNYYSTIVLVEALSRQTIDPQTLDEATRACSPALDELWKTTPIRDSIAKNDVNLAEQLRGTADAIRESSDAVLVVAGRSEGAAIRAALSAIEKKDGSPEVTVTGTSLSAAGYAIGRAHV